MKINRKTFLKSLGLGAAGTLSGTSYALSSEATRINNKLSDTIPKRKLGRNGQMVSVLCLGTGSRFTNESYLPVEEREEYLRYAISQGVNYLDTARLYGPSEEILGEILNREDWSKLVLNSKTRSNTYDDVMRDFETSCNTLKRDKIDVYLLHNNALSENVGDNAPGFAALQELREQGHIGNIGFSAHGAVTLPTAVKLVEEYDLDHLILNVDEGRRVDYRPVIPDILKKNCTVAAIKVTRPYEGMGPVESARLSYKDVLDRFFTAGIISHSNEGIGDRGWKKILDDNLETTRMFA